MSNTQEQNKVAELMKPRYKVIADFPDSINPVGTVLICRAMNDPDKWSVLEGGFKKSAIAEKFGVCYGTIYSIEKNTSWKNI